MLSIGRVSGQSNLSNGLNHWGLRTGRWSSNSPHGVFFEKLIDFQLVNKFPAFYGSQRSLPCSQEPATGSCPEPAKSSPYPPIYV